MVHWSVTVNTIGLLQCLYLFCSLYLYVGNIPELFKVGRDGLPQDLGVDADSDLKLNRVSSMSFVVHMLFICFYMW